MTSYDQLLVKRGDLTGDGVTNAADVAALYASFGATNNWLMDLNVDGTVNIADVQTLVTKFLRTTYGDFNLDRRVDGADFLILQRNLGATGARFDQGDAGLNGVVGADDLATMRSLFGATGPIGALPITTSIPEPATGAMAIIVTGAIASLRRRRSFAKTSPCNNS
jgi:hypothetical protein